MLEHKKQALVAAACDQAAGHPGSVALCFRTLLEISTSSLTTTGDNLDRSLDDIMQDSTPKSDAQHAYGPSRRGRGRGGQERFRPYARGAPRPFASSSDAKGKRVYVGNRLDTFEQPETTGLFYRCPAGKRKKTCQDYLCITVKLGDHLTVATKEGRDYAVKNNYTLLNTVSGTEQKRYFYFCVREQS